MIDFDILRRRQIFQGFYSILRENSKKIDIKTAKLKIKKLGKIPAPLDSPSPSSHLIPQ